MAPSTFGRSLRAEHFMFDKDYVPLNHGSFGTCPRIVWNEMIGYQKEEERNPDLWLRYKYYPLLEKSTAAIASLVNAEPSSVVFVSNATTAANVVMRSLKWNEGDVIFTVDTSTGVDPSPVKQRFVESLQSIRESRSWLNTSSRPRRLKTNVLTSTGPSQMMHSWPRSRTALSRSMFKKAGASALLS